MNELKILIILKNIAVFIIMLICGLTLDFWAEIQQPISSVLYGAIMFYCYIKILFEIKKECSNEKNNS